MPSDLSLIKTIVVVMMENRSFDHMLGYLRLTGGAWSKVDGIRNDPDWIKQASSVYDNSLFPPFHLTDPYDLMRADPPHEREQIALQMGTPKNGVYSMNGFVSNYATVDSVKPGDSPPVMGYFGSDEVPVTDFLAQNFAICDHWFSSLPAGTQPNRLMSMSGYSHIDVNHLVLPDQYLVYDWLTDHGVRWRVYHEGMPFFVMMPRWIPEILAGDHFRPFSQLWDDIQNEPPDEFPEVIFVEPMY
ncbi:MAG: phospholipase, partial [Acidobacteria bacterium]|nr:phospholipase [Acidobacteriota bacterium]